MDRNQTTSELISIIIYVKSISDLTRVAVPRCVFFCP